MFPKDRIGYSSVFLEKRPSDLSYPNTVAYRSKSSKSKLMLMIKFISPLTNNQLALDIFCKQLRDRFNIHIFDILR